MLKSYVCFEITRTQLKCDLRYIKMLCKFRKRFKKYFMPNVAKRTYSIFNYAYISGGTHKPDRVLN